MSLHRTLQVLCPHCASEIDRPHNSDPDDDGDIEEGDPSICVYCFEVSIVTDRFFLRLPHPGELEAMYLKYPQLRADIAILQGRAKILGLEPPEKNFGPS